MEGEKPTWICCQLGAREHYVVPRALHQRGLLDFLITDLWLPPKNLLATFNRRLRGRFHIDLAHACVRAPTTDALAFEARARLRGSSGWKLMIERNNWYQDRAVAELARDHRYKNSRKPTVYAYSYAARRILEFARERGWPTVLEQIDPGPQEARLVASLYDEHPGYRGNWQAAPAIYWQEWRKECALADRIVVNSQWSYEGLVQTGIAAEKIRILPLAFEASVEAGAFQRRYPAAFTDKRPLRVLFLGQINPRKGIVQLLEAANLLGHEPVEFWIVGAVQVAVPAALRGLPQIKWIGPVARGQVAQHYREADVFIFPTLSDGFGLTQLEAQSWKLPVVASRNCADVVRDGVNGVTLPEVSPQAIASVLQSFLRDPTQLQDLAARSGIEDRFCLDSLATSLMSL